LSSAPGWLLRSPHVLPWAYVALHPQADDHRRRRGYRPAVNWLRDIRPRDVRIAAIVAAVQIGGTIGASHRHAHHGCWWASSCSAPTHLDALAVVLMALGPIALLLRRRYPRAVLAAVFAIGLLYVCLGYVQGPNYASCAVAVINAVIAGDRFAARAAVLAGWALFLWLPAALGKTSGPTWLAALSIAAWLLLLLGAAEALRSRRERFAEARRAREQEARRRASEERLRIARELHDVLAHNISLINVQSGVALHLIDEQPEQARTALTAINEASADALREVRSALSALRGDGEQPPRAPTAGLDGLDELLSRASAAGVEVSLDVSGDRRPLPASVDLAAFRIVQESLTNIVRHAGATAASVRLTYGDGELTLQIEDDGHGGAANNGGSGIAGMRERAVALGGRLDAGPGAGGGFRVCAHLPLARQQ
jgi:signal transduction histidine kinase